jgi:hypothetical protein
MKNPMSSTEDLVAYLRDNLVSLTLQLEHVKAFKDLEWTAENFEGEKAAVVAKLEGKLLAKGVADGPAGRIAMKLYDAVSKAHPAARLDGLSLRDEEFRSVRTSLPSLERHPNISGSDSSTRTGHEGAYLEEADFPVVEDVGKPRGGASRIWLDLSQSNRAALSWSTEASIVQLVVQGLKDMLYECGLSGLLEIVPEAGTFELRPDLWIVRVGGVPVGVVEVKKPGDGVLDDERVLGELYDYMTHLPNFYGTRQVIGILTTYREWRVCWLDNDDTRALVSCSAVIPGEDERKEEAMRTPKKLAVAGEEKDTSPPGFTPSKKRTNYHEIGEPEEIVDDDEGPSIAEEPREMLGTRVWSIEKDNIFQLIASALLKMSKVTHQPFGHPFDKLEQRTLLRVDQDSFFWERLKPDTVGKWVYTAQQEDKVFLSS